MGWRLATQHGTLDAAASLLAPGRMASLSASPEPWMGCRHTDCKRKALTASSVCISLLWLMYTIAFTNFGQMGTACLSLQVIQRVCRKQHAQSQLSACLHAVEGSSFKHQCQHPQLSSPAKAMQISTPSVFSNVFSE